VQAILGKFHIFQLVKKFLISQATEDLLPFSKIFSRQFGSTPELQTPFV
jgi:hypothetical protein